MQKYDWAKLNPLHIGKCAEYFVKMEFAFYGYHIYSAEVDDHGIDIVVRKEQGIYYDIQVKSVRDYKYIFFLKDRFVLRPDLLAAIVIFFPLREPLIYLIPSMSWHNLSSLLVSRDYVDKKSDPEWGVNLSKSNAPLLEQFEFDKMIQKI